MHSTNWVGGHRFALGKAGGDRVGRLFGGGDGGAEAEATPFSSSRRSSGGYVRKSRQRENALRHICQRAGESGLLASSTILMPTMEPPMTVTERISPRSAAGRQRLGVSHRAHAQHPLPTVTPRGAAGSAPVASGNAVEGPKTAARLGSGGGSTR